MNAGSLFLAHCRVNQLRVINSSPDTCEKGMNRRRLRSFYVLLGVLIPLVLFVVGTSSASFAWVDTRGGSCWGGLVLAGQFMLGAALMLGLHLLRAYRQLPWERYNEAAEKRGVLRGISHCCTRAVRSVLAYRRAPLEGSLRLLPGKLAVIVVYCNPMLSEDYRANYRRTLHSLAFWDVDIFRVEVVFKGDTVDSRGAFLRFHAEDKHRVWQHERVINAAVRQLPDGYDKVGIIDSGVILVGSQSIERATRLLSRFPIVQLFTHLMPVGLWGRVLEAVEMVKGQEMGDETNEATVSRVNALPVRALLLRRDVFPLYERFGSPQGLSALLQVFASGERYFERHLMSPKLTEDFGGWVVRRCSTMKGGIGCIRGNGVRLFNGEDASPIVSPERRENVLRQFDPACDIDEDAGSGLLAISQSCSPELRLQLGVESVVFRSIESSDCPRRLGDTSGVWMRWRRRLSARRTWNPNNSHI